MCFSPIAINPQLSWTTVSSNVNSCELKSTNLGSGNYSIKGITTSPIIDSKFTGVTTHYVLSCEVGDTSYSGGFIEIFSNTRVLTTCQPDYNISMSSTCVPAGKNVSIPGANLIYDPTTKNYTGVLSLKASTLYGFNKDISLSGLAPNGTLGFNPKPPIFSGGQGTVEVKLTLPEAIYDSLKANHPPATPIPGALGSLVDVSLTAKASGYIDKTIKFGFCDGTGVLVKPIYTPF